MAFFLVNWSTTRFISSTTRLLSSTCLSFPASKISINHLATTSFLTLGFFAVSGCTSLSLRLTTFAMAGPFVGIVVGWSPAIDQLEKLSVGE